MPIKKRKKDRKPKAPLYDSDALEAVANSHGRRIFYALTVAGGEVLQRDFGFSEEQAALWAIAANELAVKYLRLETLPKTNE